ncbi:MAG TPA: hypothetical protein VGS15_05495 [Candidatus Acidoferrales bacterium]|nr:hypothetical protein [Candidatus Acidoferrales bacterium]
MKKGSLKDRLFQVGVETLEKEGWSVRRIRGIGKSSVRQITKGGKSLKVAIRTSQDRWIAFPRDGSDKSWVTLSEVDIVLAVSVDDGDNPKFALVHFIDAGDMRRRFDRAYKARRAAGRKIPLGRGMWLPLYHPDAANPLNDVGGGAGLDYPAIARVPLHSEDSISHDLADREQAAQVFTIAEAKRRLAAALGVDPSSIKITVEA